MAIVIGSNFKYVGKLPNFERDLFDTIEAMKNYDESGLPDLFMAQCKEDKGLYIFDINNPVDVTTGKWRKFEGGGNVEQNLEMLDNNSLDFATLEPKLYLLNAFDGKANFKVKDGTEEEKELSSNLIHVVKKYEDGDADKTLLGYIYDKDGNFVKVAYDENTASKVSFEIIVQNTVGVITYTNETPTPKEVLGVSAGTTFNDKTIKEMFDMIFYPYMQPEASLSTNAGKTLFDIIADANTLTSLAVTVQATKKSNPITSVKAWVGAEELTMDNPAQDIANGGNVLFNYAKPIQATTTIRCEVGDGTKTATANATLTFVGSSYSGWIGEGATADEATIKGLTKTLKNGKGMQINGTGVASQRYVYAYPKSFGNCNTINDNNGFSMVASTTLSTVQVDGIEYNVYVANNGATVENTYFVKFA